MAKRSKVTVDEISGPAGSQTLLRGLDILEASANGAASLDDLTKILGLNRSTVHRLGAALVSRKYLNFARGEGYTLGPKLMELGFMVQQQYNLVKIARPHLLDLNAETNDTIHLAMRDENSVFYLDKLPGRRNIEQVTRVGDRQPLHVTGLGKALMLDWPEEKWIETYKSEIRKKKADKFKLPVWIKQMRKYASGGYAFDLEENEPHIRCVAVPIRNVSGEIIAALSVASVVRYMETKRMVDLVDAAKDTASAISRGLGWTGKRIGRDGRNGSKRLQELGRN